MEEQYKEPYTRFIVADVQNGTLNELRLREMQEDFTAHPQADPEYLASLDEAIKLLYGPEQLVMRMRDRKLPGSEVQ
jgi:hypothetical protein